jgi:quercetin dioxygenase-like cupin family protein
MTAIQTFDIKSLKQDMKGDSIEYREFLKNSSLSSGIYHLAKGSADPQSPHEQDEIYYVLAGKASFNSDSGTESIEQGSVIFVAGEAQHRFVDIEEDLTLLVFFAEKVEN